MCGVLMIITRISVSQFIPILFLSFSISLTIFDVQVWTISAQWQNESDDAVVLAWIEQTLESIHAANKAKGLAIEFLYLNDAADYQKGHGYDGIAKGNLEKMKRVRARYDPEGVFSWLCSGGFKFD